MSYTYNRVTGPPRSEHRRAEGRRGGLSVGGSIGCMSCAKNECRALCQVRSTADWPRVYFGQVSIVFMEYTVRRFYFNTPVNLSKTIKYHQSIRLLVSDR